MFNYFFPSPLQKTNFNNSISEELKFSFDSGENALRFILRNLKIVKGSNVAIPAFVCNAVKNSVLKEEFNPIYFDLKNDETYWTDYDFQKILSNDIRVLILVHLYGFLHPDTNSIVDFCKKNNIILIHDAAQSYGIDEKLMIEGAIVYSSSGGKSSTAAGGAWVKNFDAHNYNEILLPPFYLLKNIRSKLFLKSRIYNYKYSSIERLYSYLFRLFASNSIKIYSMVLFQKKATSFLINNIKKINVQRKMNYDIIKEKIILNKSFKIAYDDNNGMYYKLVLFVEKSEEFVKYLTINKIPFFRLADSISVGNKELNHFKVHAFKFIELSSESSIDGREILRISHLLSKFE